MKTTTEIFIYTKKSPKGMSKDTIAYNVKLWELPFAIIIENFNIKKITFE